MEQENQEFQEDLGTGGKLKNWLQDNIRIIISVLIVIAIAGGIYSYSNRGEDLMTEEEIAMEEIEQGENLEEDQEDESLDVIEDEDADDEIETTDAMDSEEDNNEEVEVAEPAKEVVKETVSEETGEAFIVKAASGDSVTTLSRQALRDYLEKNNDSNLTAEHKIYIEDYLRKNVNHSGALYTGDDVSFSKQLIQNAIEKSKTLNENQLENLKKYSARVSNL
jgi:hypothetical protein